MEEEEPRKARFPTVTRKFLVFLFSGSSETVELADAEFLGAKGASLALTSPAAACHSAVNNFRPAPGIPTTVSCRRSRIAHPCAVAANLCAPGVPSPCLAAAGPSSRRACCAAFQTASPRLTSFASCELCLCLSVPPCSCRAVLLGLRTRLRRLVPCPVAVSDALRSHRTCAHI